MDSVSSETEFWNNPIFGTHGISLYSTALYCVAKLYSFVYEFLLLDDQRQRIECTKESATSNSYDNQMGHPGSSITSISISLVTVFHMQKLMTTYRVTEFARKN